MLFKELKKSILKNSMKINRGISTYVGKSIIENKEKYRIPYGSLGILFICQIALINYDLIELREFLRIENLKILFFCKIMAKLFSPLLIFHSQI